MSEQSRELYAAFKSKDSRFDGRFFVGVRSTGIYCRPVCRARLPRAESCVFFQTAAEAEKAGFRPCLICRPELAPGLSATDARAALAKRAARYLEENCGDCPGMEALAARLGYTGRHLRRVFAEEYHVSPVEYLQTCRLLLAKGLLTDTDLSVTEVAMAAGFGSLRRFNSLFQSRYRLSPTGFRKRAKTGGTDGGVTVALGYRPPYAWERILRFLSLRAIPGVESVADGAYSRTVRMARRDGGELLGWIRVTNRPEKNVLTLRLSESLLPVLPQVLGRVRGLFDLSCDPQAVGERLGGGNAPGAYVGGLRVPGCFDRFELCARAILGQQISVKAAGALAGKMAAALGTPVDTGTAELRCVFPSAADVAHLPGRIEETLGPLGIIAARAGAIQALARLLEAREPALDFGADLEAEKQRLLRIRGVGPWTAAYIAMRALGDTDAFPETDLGLRKALGGKRPGELRALSAPWRPWRSYATMALWDSL